MIPIFFDGPTKHVWQCAKTVKFGFEKGAQLKFEMNLKEKIGCVNTT